MGAGQGKDLKWGKRRKDMAKSEEPISHPKSLKETMKVGVFIETDDEGRLLMKLEEAAIWLYSVLVTALIKTAEKNGESIPELQERVNASLRFIAVKRGEVKKTLEDRTAELRVSFLKKMLEELASYSGNSIDEALTQLTEFCRRRAARENNGKEV